MHNLAYNLNRAIVNMITFERKPLLEGSQHPLAAAEAHSLRLEDKISFSRSLGELLQVVQTDISRGIQPEGASLPVSCDQLTRAILLAAAGSSHLLSEAGITLREDCLGIVNQLIYLNRSDMFPTKSKLDWMLTGIGEALKHEPNATTIMVGTNEITGDLRQMFSEADYGAHRQECLRRAGFVSNIPPCSYALGLLEEGTRQGLLLARE